MLRGWIFSAFALALFAQVPPQVHVEGRILSSDGKPLAGAIVALVFERAGYGLPPLREGRTDSKGNFKLEGIPGRYGLTVTAPGCLPHFRNLELKAGIPALPLEISLEKGGCRIQGRLLPAPGHAMEGARVGFSNVSEDSGYQFFGELKQGNFDITLASGDYQAIAEAKGQAGGRRFEVRSDQPNAFIQLRALSTPTEPTPAGPETLAWIKGNAIPLAGVEAGKGIADMQPLKALIGDATVVGLGEATHGTREFFQLKHRMLEFLATEMGFTVFAIEANLPEAFAVNDYVLRGKGDPAKALAGLYFWTWNTEEVLNLIRWMRAYNQDPAHPKKLHFYGVDMQYGKEALAQAKLWLEGAEPAEAARLAAIGAPLPKLPRKSQGSLSEVDRRAWADFGREIEALIGRLEARRPADGDFDRQRQNLRVLTQLAALQGDPTGGFAMRDAAMAANLQWIQAREGGAKMVLWAHNLHITARPGSRPGPSDSLGVHLRRRLGAAYRPIGFAFREGGFQAMGQGKLQAFEVAPQARGTLDAALAAAGHPVLALDLQKRPGVGPVKTWLESPQGTRNIGAGFTPGQDFIQESPITEDYDALLFVGRTTRAVPVGAKLD